MTRVRSSDAPVLSPRVALLTRLLRADVPASDPRFAALRDAAHEGDPLAERALDVPRAQLEAAIEHGLPRGAPPALAQLFADIERVPAWLDRALLRRGGEVMVRHGLDGMTSLSGALMGGYLGSSATKPLVATGALVGHAAVRLARTTRFVVHVATSGEMDRFSPGFQDAIRVRMMHAHVRRQLARTPGFPLHWGVPISQRDMVATHLQFTMTYLLGVLALGRLDPPRDWEAVLHLWRYVSHILGVRDALLPKSVREGFELVSIFNMTEPGPDDDGRALAGALMQVWRGQALRDRLIGSYLLGYSRYVLGDEAADQLRVPNTRWKHVPPALALLRLPWEVHQLLWPAARERGRRAGRKLLELHSNLLMTHAVG